MSLLRHGIEIIKTHSRLWILFVLVILFPLLFLYFYSTELAATETNVATVLRDKISVTHDAITLLLGADTGIPAISLKEFALTQEDLRKLQLVQEENGSLVVVFDAFSSSTGETVSVTEPFRTALIQPGSTYIFPYHTDRLFREQAFRALQSSDKSTMYLFTEHDFTNLYSLVEARSDRPLLILGIIFLFILWVAYWLARQINFETLYAKKVNELTERDTFMSSLVHELRAPLTAMRGYASMIEEATSVPAAEREYAIRIRESTTRLVVLVNDFLEAARIQSGKLPLTIAPVDINDLLATAVAAAEPTAAAKGLTLSGQWASHNLVIESDEKRLTQIVTNLISNAIKYTPHGSVTISASEQFGRLNITVADTGSGIAANDQKKLFSPFVRVGNEEQRRAVTGTGLGMWITKQLVEQLAGEITLESIKGVGTHVRVSLPKKLTKPTS